MCHGPNSWKNQQPLAQHVAACVVYTLLATRYGQCIGSKQYHAGWHVARLTTNCCAVEPFSANRSCSRSSYVLQSTCTAPKAGWETKLQGPPGRKPTSSILHPSQAASGVAVLFVIPLAITYTHRNARCWLPRCAAYTATNTGTTKQPTPGRAGWACDPVWGSSEPPLGLLLSQP